MDCGYRSYWAYHFTVSKEIASFLFYRCACLTGFPFYRCALLTGFAIFPFLPPNTLNGLTDLPFPSRLYLGPGPYRLSPPPLPQVLLFYYSNAHAGFTIFTISPRYRPKRKNILPLFAIAAILARHLWFYLSNYLTGYAVLLRCRFLQFYHFTDPGVETHPISLG